MNAIEASALTKVYRGLFRSRGGQQALRGVDLTVPCGTVFGLIGPNGAGKTTFIKTFLGIVRQTSGTVKVLDGDPEDPRVRSRIGYLPERLHLPQAWTPVQFLASVARLKQLRAARPQIDSLLVRVGLAPDAQRRIGGFSKGMRQRLGLAAALLGTPELLVLDEPTDGIDPLGRMEVRRLLAEERERGATIFLNSHLLSETERVCDRVGILHGGKVVREGRLDDLTRSETRWRLRLAGAVDAAAMRAAGLIEMSGTELWRCEASDAAALNQVLDRCRAAGALIVELQRDERELEDVLAEAVGAPQGSASEPAQWPASTFSTGRGAA
ncbi:MAG TPA: ABC transporter ATP-binding protein [Myxococcales bacterium]|jgi:ABC-2 type transport system ATP-binding protein